MAELFSIAFRSFSMIFFIGFWFVLKDLKGFSKEFSWMVSDFWVRSASFL